MVPHELPTGCRQRVGQLINSKTGVAAHRLTGREVVLNRIAEILNGEQGQDLVEYTLLLAFVMLASAALYVNAGGSVTGIWTMTNSQLSSGIVAAGS